MLCFLYPEFGDSPEQCKEISPPRRLKPMSLNRRHKLAKENNTSRRENARSSKAPASLLGFQNVSLGERTQPEFSEFILYRCWKMNHLEHGRPGHSHFLCPKRTSEFQLLAANVRSRRQTGQLSPPRQCHYLKCITGLV